MGDGNGVVLRMLPVDDQVQGLLDSGRYEDTLALCAFSAERYHGDTRHIEERYAYALYSRGDFEGASQRWLSAETLPQAVTELFPTIQPPELSTFLRAKKEVLEAPLHTSARASTSVAPEKRHALNSIAVLRGASLSRAAAAVATFFEMTRRRLNACDRAPTNKNACDAQLMLVDTMLVAAWLQCSPPRIDDRPPFS